MNVHTGHNEPPKLRLLYVSVRGRKYLLGAPTVHPVDAVPPAVGTTFASHTEIERYVYRELHGISAIWRVEAIDANGCGERWAWHDHRLNILMKGVRPA